jgi:hypothetical protein
MRRMAERPAVKRRLKNRPLSARASASPPARKQFEREGPGRSAELPRRELEEVRELDPDGRIVVHGRLVDSLGRMRRSDTIDRAMYDAARAFQAAFAIANLDPIRAAAMLRVPGSDCEPDLSEQQLDARRRVHEALQALGGINSPAGSCVWHVVGCGCSIREWAIRRGWSGRPVRQEQAQGILIAALGVLASSDGHRNG